MSSVPNTSRVLLVDDELPILDITCEFLALDPEFNIDTASSAMDGLQKLKDGIYDAVVTDYEMPEMNGIQFLKEVRKTDDLPFILFTGRGREEVAIEAINSGVNFYIRKGGDPRTQFGELANAIRQVIARRRAEQARLEAEEHYHSLYDQIISIIYTTDLQGKIVDANPAVLKMIGYSKEETIGMKIMDLVVPEEVPKVLDSILEIAQTGTQKQYNELRFRRKDGGCVDVEAIGSLLYHDGEPYAIQEMGLDITERRHAEEDLRKSEVRTRTLVQTIPDLVWLKDKDGAYLTCNAMFERFFGAKEADIVGRTDYEFVDHELADFFRQHDRMAIEAGKSISNEEWVTFKDDNHHALLETIKTPMYDVDGTLIGVLGIGRDVTERKQMLDKLKNLNRMHALLSDINQMIVRTEDQDRLFHRCCQIAVETGKFKMASVSLIDFDSRTSRPAAMYGEVTNFLDDMIASIDEIPDHYDLVGTAIRENRMVFFSNDACDPGAESWREQAAASGFNSAVVMPLSQHEKVVGAIGLYSTENELFDEDEVRLLEEIASDISFALSSIDNQQKRSVLEEKLAERERRFRSTLDSMLEGCQIIDPDWRYLYVNDSVAQHGRVTKDGLLGHTMMEVYPGIEMTKMFADLKDCMETHTPHRLMNEFAFTDGGKGWFVLSIEPVPEGIFILSQDVTEQENSRARIEHLNKVLQAIRLVNQLIVRQKDPDVLMQSVCNALVQTRGFSTCWVALIDDSMRINRFFGAGFGDFDEKKIKMMEGMEIPQCGIRALHQAEIGVITNPRTACVGCPLSEAPKGSVVLTHRLELENRVFGLLAISIPTEFSDLEQELSLVKEVAEDLAFALHTIELKGR